MKKILALFAAALTALMVVSCGSTPAAQEAPKSNVPEWVTMGKMDATGIYAVGAGKMANAVTSRKMAMSQGRTELARTLKAEIKAVTQTYIDDAGSDKDRQALAAFQESTLEKTQAILQGSQQVDYYLGDDGTVYVLMYLPYDSAVKTLNEEAAKSKGFKENQTAAFTKEQMAEAFERHKDFFDAE